MEEIKEYLKQRDFGGKDFAPDYQLGIWAKSSVVAGVQQIVIPTDSAANILFILVKLISISTDGLGGTITFSDKRNPAKPFFTIHNNISAWTTQNFVYLVEDTKLTIVSDSATVQFSILYYPISKKHLVKQ